MSWPAIDERQAAAMCYTSGTTGRPKGVIYSHRALVLHSLVFALPDALGISSRDVILPAVPMFHVNGWNLPFTAALTGAKLVLPGPRLDPVSLLDLLEGERVTFTAGVPTVWMAVLQAIDAEPDRWDLRSLEQVNLGGAAVPASLIAGFERHGLTIVQGWGMTETSPLGTLSKLPADLESLAPRDQYEYRARQGTPIPLIEIRARGDDGALIPWNDQAMGELEIRGPWVAAAYHGGTGGDKFTDDGWFRTGDVVRINERGCMRICDRAKDLVKSGGEWISSVDLENQLMAHSAVAEAAVIAIPDEKWGERPLAAVVLRDGMEASPEELREHLGSEFAKWQLPDRIEFIEAIPRTATGKFKKTALARAFRRGGLARIWPLSSIGRVSRRSVQLSSEGAAARNPASFARKARPPRRSLQSREASTRPSSAPCLSMPVTWYAQVCFARCAVFPPASACGPTACSANEHASKASEPHTINRTRLASRNVNAPSTTKTTVRGATRMGTS